MITVRTATLRSRLLVSLSWSALSVLGWGCPGGAALCGCTQERSGHRLAKCNDFSEFTGQQADEDRGEICGFDHRAGITCPGIANCDFFLREASYMVKEARFPRWVGIFLTMAGGFFLCTGCCATCYHHAGLGEDMVRPGAVFGPPGAAHAYYPGPLSGLWRVLGIGAAYPCDDCGPRYWGDWGGDHAHCEPCDDYGQWVGSADLPQNSSLVITAPDGECKDCGRLPKEELIGPATAGISSERPSRRNVGSVNPVSAGPVLPGKFSATTVSTARPVDPSRYRNR